MNKKLNQKLVERLKIKNVLQFLFHPRDFLNFVSKDIYRSLKVRIILIDAIVSLVPLFIVVTISYFWFQSILKEDFRTQLSWQMENVRQSIEFFIGEKLSALRFIASTYSYEQLSDRKELSYIFSKFKKEFTGFVDLGVIDSDGVQQAYVGPYRLQGKDYSAQEWFKELIVRPKYVSDVFLGYRRIPHFTIAVKQEVPEKETFWILRATIDVETIKKYITAINLEENDDAFIIDYNGVLQTSSHFHGKVLEKVSIQIPSITKDVTVYDFEQPDGKCTMCGFAPIKDTPWILIAHIRSTPYGKIPQIFRNELFFIAIISILISIGVTIGMAHTVVNRIKKSDQEREEAITKSEHASKLASIGRLAAGVAHEINNPLAIINEKAGLMRDLLESSKDVKNNREKFLSLLSGIFDSINRCRTITHRLLGFSRRVEISHEEFDLNDAVREVVGFLEKEILFRNIRLDLKFNEKIPRIVSDKGQLQQVFLNIINNAIDAVDEGDLIEITTGVKDKDKVEVSIRDTGHGIPKDKLKHIFEPFYTTKEKGKGTGLGLSISYGIMQKLGGTILVTSEVGKGTTFTIIIPINI